MEYNSTSELISSDPKSKEYFNSLPQNVQKELLDRYTGAKNLDELRSFADDIRVSI